MAANKEVEEVIPPQEAGAKKDVEEVKVNDDRNDAVSLFNIARTRMMDINHWDQLCGKASATFTLTDSNGSEINRTAEKGDYFKIDLPAPGSAEGKGYDWVFIEEIIESNHPDGAYESIVIQVRPTANPQDKGENVAHFFNEESTSSFVLERQDKTVKAAVYGRNEIPNTATSHVVDKVRNAVVAITAILGFSNLQWRSLVKGLLST
ncbi:MAG: hypothetical protein ABIR06_03255 [Cyclobacteriaceae bacterium]